MFDSILDLDSVAAEKGREEGFASGRAKGRGQARGWGESKGYELATEAAFYEGCCATWLAIESGHPGTFPPKAVKGMDGVVQHASQVPRINSQDADVMLSFETLKGKFKTVTTLIGLPRFSFDPQGLGKAASEPLSF